MKSLCKALLLALAISVTPACAVGMSPTVRTVVMQRHDRDCLVAAVAMLGGWRYEEVDLARRVLSIPFKPEGLEVRDGMRILTALGHRVSYLPPPALDIVPGPRGILITSDPGQTTGHAVLIDSGLIYDPQIPYTTPWVLWFHERPETVIDGIVVIE